jgi:hypothetical protein
MIAFLAVDVGAGALALFCFDKQGKTGGVLNSRVYDCINLAVSGAFLLRSVVRSNIRLQDPREAGICSYEFLTTVMLVQTVIYGVVFFNTQDQTDFGRSLSYGFSLGMVSVSILLAALKHCKASDSPRRASDLEEKFFFENHRDFSTV